MSTRCDERKKRISEKIKEFRKRYTKENHQSDECLGCKPKTKQKRN